MKPAVKKTRLKKPGSVCLLKMVIYLTNSIFFVSVLLPALNR